MDETIKIDSSSQPRAAGGADVFTAGERVGGRYTIEALVGRGGMGIVYRARQDLTDKTVALKVVDPRHAGGSLLDRFLDEIRVLGRLEHPGLARIHDADLHRCADGSECVFFTMELVKGVPITTWVAEKNLSRERIVALLAKTCEAVQYAHDHQVIHCDLKPANILVRESGEPVVIDFGLAYLREQSSGTETPVRASPAPRAAGGTPAYMSPEQFQAGITESRAGQSVDVYALGVVAFQLLAGRMPYDWLEPPILEEIRRAVLFDSPRRLADLRPDIDPELDLVIAKALRKDPADRYFSVASFLRALNRFLPASIAEPEASWKPEAGKLIPSTNWVLDEKLGEGGVGEVWTCHHRNLKSRRIAKFCADEEKAAYLRRELTLYRLLKEKVGQNEHFVRLEEVALDEPPYYLMSEFVEAMDFAKWAKAHGGVSAIRPPALIELIAQAAEALQAAHDTGIIHRDIKPSNLLVRGEPHDHGSLHLWVSDFGIGTVMSDDILGGQTRGGFTRTLLGSKLSSYSGTQLYMAPELLAGGEATVRSDIYALGVVLYQALTGDFHKAITIDWHRHIKDPLLRDDLDHCFAGDPNERFASAGQLAENLRRIPERRTEAARAAAALAARERAAYRRGVARASMVAAAVLAAVGGLTVYAFKMRAMERKAHVDVLLQQARTLENLTDPDAATRALEIIARAAQDAPTTKSIADLRETAVFHLTRPGADKAEHVTIRASPRAVLNSTASHICEVNPDGSVSVSTVSSGKAVPDWQTPVLPAPAETYVLNDNGSAIAAITKDKAVVRVAAKGASAWNAIACAAPPRNLCWDGKTGLAVAMADKSIMVWPDVIGAGAKSQRHHLSDAPTPALAAIVPREETSARDVSVLMDSGGKWIALRESPSQSVILRSLDSPAAFATLFHPRKVSAMAWSPPRKGQPPILAVGCDDGSVHLWEMPLRAGAISSVSRPDHVLRLQGRDEEYRVQSLGWRSDSGRLAVLHHPSLVRLWDYSWQKATWVIGGAFRTADAAQDLFIDASGSPAVRLAGGSLMLWRNDNHAVFRERPLSHLPWEDLAACPDHSVVIGVHHAGAFAIDPRSLAIRGEYFSAFASRAEFGKDHREVFLSRRTGVGAFQWKAGAEWVKDDKGPGIGTLDFRLVTADGQLAVVARLDDRLTLYLPKRGRAQKAIPIDIAAREHDSWDASPDGQWLGVARSGASGVSLYSIQWQLNPQAPAAAVSRETGAIEATGVRNLRFSPDSQSLAMWTPGGIELHSVQSRQRSVAAFAVTSTDEPESPAMAFAASGRMLATVTPHHDILLLGTSQGAGGNASLQVLSPLRRLTTRPVRDLEFCGPDGRLLLVATEDGYIQSWQLESLRRRLKLIGLDWDAPDFPAVNAPSPPPAAANTTGGP